MVFLRSVWTIPFDIRGYAVGREVRSEHGSGDSFKINNRLSHCIIIITLHFISRVCNLFRGHQCCKQAIGDPRGMWSGYGMIDDSNINIRFIKGKSFSLGFIKSYQLIKAK